MKTILILVLLSFVGFSGANAESATKAVHQDLDAARTRLNLQREAQFTAQALTGGNIHALEQKLLAARRKNQLAMMSSSARGELVKKIKAENRVFTDDASYLSNIYDELSLQLEVMVNSAGKFSVGEMTTSQSGGVNDLGLKADLLDNAFDQIEAMLGGELAESKVVGDQGHIIVGTTYSVGPVSWFLSTDGQYAGYLKRGLGGELPVLSDDESAEVKQLFNGESIELAVDVTGGKARAIDEIQSDPLDLLRKGGVWLWPILLIALISIFCGCMKFLQLSKIREPNTQWVAGILSAVRSDDLDSAKKIALSCNHPAAEMISAAMQYISAGADVVEEVVYEQLIGVQSKLQKWLPFIAVTAATAPLLGLLGTVSGMIRMFNVITVTGTGDVKPMAGGISEALVTTLFGLVVAIPALVLHTMLSRRSNGVVQNTEKLGLTFVNGLRKL